MRHAHAESPGYGGEDFDRPLSAQGLADSAAAAREMRAAGLVPSRIIASPARRTRQTAETVAGELGLPDSALQFVDALYNASIATLWSELQRASGDGLLLLVAHNPGISALARQLSRDTGRQPFAPAGWGRFPAPGK
jgi:phosphohistidine phosphatase SixA